MKSSETKHVYAAMKKRDIPGNLTESTQASDASATGNNPTTATAGSSSASGSIGNAAAGDRSGLNNKSTTTSPVPTTSTSDVTKSTGSAASDTSTTSSSQSSGLNRPAGLSSGPAAGLAIGMLVGGLAIGLLLAFFLLRKKYRRQMNTAERRWDAERNDIINSSSDKMITPALTYAPDPATERKLKDAQARIKTLETERNAASAFGDKLDGKAESELLDSPAFGLSVLNERINQLAMSLAVSSSGKGQLGSGPFTKNTSDVIKSVANMGPQQANQQFETVARHVINGTMFERIAAPFCFEASEAGRSSGLLKLAKEVQRASDQAMYARWRSMTHSTLRSTSEKKANESAPAVVQQHLFNTVVELLLWSGMEPDVNSAGATASKVHARLGEVINMMAQLMKVIREEMATCNYAVIASLPLNQHLTKSLGMTATEEGASTPRIVLESKT